MPITSGPSEKSNCRSRQIQGEFVGHDSATWNPPLCLRLLACVALAIRLRRQPRRLKASSSLGAAAITGSEGSVGSGAEAAFSASRLAFSSASCFATSSSFLRSISSRSSSGRMWPWTTISSTSRPSMVSSSRRRSAIISSFSRSLQQNAIGLLVGITKDLGDLGIDLAGGVLAVALGTGRLPARGT